MNDAFYRTLLESTKAIPWQIDWQTMTFSYIGPQIKELLGWETDSWLSANDWAERMHPDDRDWVVDFCISQSKDGVDHEADYRALTNNGDYVWIRDVVHVIRDEHGETVSLVGFMFDINARKKSEEELLKLKQELEELSYQDSLTGVANRRLYDAFIAREWDTAIRNHTAISMIMIDIDFFKQGAVVDKVKYPSNPTVFRAVVLDSHS
uniref:GGDEF domain-containing protein n=1 Tax=uncultured Acinetobacter sp. TaxID=165433 RepID=UPI00262CC692